MGSLGELSLQVGVGEGRLSTEPGARPASPPLSEEVVPAKAWEVGVLVVPSHCKHKGGSELMVGVLGQPFREAPTLHWSLHLASLQLDAAWR